MATANLRPTQEDVLEALRAYLDAIALAEPLQARLWQAGRLTMTQLVVLRALRAGPRTVGELAGLVGLSGASMTRLLDRLADRSLVARERSQVDRRAVVVHLEPAGHRLLGELHVLRGTVLEQAVQNMTPASRQALARTLRELVRRAALPSEPGEAR